MPLLICPPLIVRVCGTKNWGMTCPFSLLGMYAHRTDSSPVSSLRCSSSHILHQVYPISTPPVFEVLHWWVSLSSLTMLSALWERIFYSGLGPKRRRKHFWVEDSSYAQMSLVVVDVQEERESDRVNKGIADTGCNLFAESRCNYNQLKICPDCYHDKGEHKAVFDIDLGHHYYYGLVCDVFGAQGNGPDY